MQPGQSNVVQNLIPQTSYQIRWEAVGYDPADVTPGDPTTITTTPPEVDASIQNDGDTDFIGQQIWSLDGDGESVQQAVRVGNAATYNIQVTNGEPTSDDFVITGPGTDANWTISYFDAQGHDITTQVTGFGYIAHGLGAGQTCNLSVEVAPNLGVADGTTKDVLVTATIGSDPAQQDAVLATTTAITQMIDKLQYSLDDGTTWNDVPQPGDVNYPLAVDQRAEVEFRAVKANGDVDWPADKPVWHGAGRVEGNIGESTWSYFDDYSHTATDFKIVTAECHNSITAQIRVTPQYAIYLDNDDTHDGNLDILAGGAPVNLATTTFWAQVVDPDGNPVPDTNIQFSSFYDDGTPAGVINNSGTADATAVTDVSGWTSISLTSGTKAKEAIIVASATIANEDIFDAGFVSFHPPQAAVQFSGWADGVNGQKQQQCNVTVTYNNTSVPNRAIKLRLQVTDSAGNQVSSDYQNAAQLQQTTGTSDANGLFSTTLKWIPPTADPTADPNQYQIIVYVDDATITN